MRIRDPLYGGFRVPSWLEPFVRSPEVRRLSQIRLLNTLTPSLATLGEIRRYSHTLGVLYLWTQLELGSFSRSEVRALALAVLAHDIATAPFGHLVEYELSEKYGWSHEDVIDDVFWGSHAPENRAHQIFGPRTVEFGDLLEKSSIDRALVEAIVNSEHPLSEVLFGGLDIDNCDNVYRMAWALGLDADLLDPVRIARRLSVTKTGTLQLERDEGEVLIDRWLQVRRRIYDILVFDPDTTAAQAVLACAIAKGVHEGDITVEEWVLSDEQLIDRLLEHRSTKEMVGRYYLGRVPWPVFSVQIKGSLSDFGFDRRLPLQEIIEENVNSALGSNQGLGYLFVDRGAFSKELEFLDASRGEVWKAGQQSMSLVCYGFSLSKERPTISECRRAFIGFLDEVGVTADVVNRVYLGKEIYDDWDQLTLNIEAPLD